MVVVATSIDYFFSTPRFICFFSDSMMAERVILHLKEPVITRNQSVIFPSSSPNPSQHFRCSIWGLDLKNVKLGWGESVQLPNKLVDWFVWWWRARAKTPTIPKANLLTILLYLQFNQSENIRPRFYNTWFLKEIRFASALCKALVALLNDEWFFEWSKAANIL